MPVSDSGAVVEELKTALNGKDLDFGEILALAGKLAKNDPNLVRFTIDAAHLSRLGLELVSKQETAIAELVKNAYDADATSVDLIFKNTDAAGGSLEIVDNGMGMSRNQLIDGFMRISTSDKTTNPYSEKYRRERAGKKGIGRFAAQRLGHHLTILTKKEGETTGYRVDIDWDAFKQGQELSHIGSPVVETNEILTPGTTLKITNLRDSWGLDQITRANRIVSSLQQPFSISRLSSSTNADPGFHASFHRDEGEDVATILDHSRLYGFAVAEISGRIDDNGVAFYSIKSERYAISDVDIRLSADKENADVPYSDLRKAEFKAYYYIHQADLLPRVARKEIRDVLERWGGVRVYRNGFRVLPYGEDGDDWLALDRSSGRREILPPHANNNFLGVIELTDQAGSIFQETAGREGLVETNAFFELKDFVHRTLKAGALRVAAARGKKQKASDYTGTPQQMAAKIIEKLVARMSDSPDIARRLEEIKSDVLALGETSQSLIDDMSMLRVLSSLGLSIGEFTHEIRHTITALSADSAGLKQKFLEGSSEQKSVIRLQSNLENLQAYARYFDDAITENVYRELVALELRDVINGFRAITEPAIKRAGVSLETKFDGYDLYCAPMHRSEWTSILLNLFTNSLKAIRRAGVDGSLMIVAGKGDNNVFVEFSDNGDGIADAIKDRIFEAFVTTSSPPSALASHNEDMIGTGLGLKITRDIVQSNGGDISVVTPPQGYKTCFRVQMPKASDVEILNAES